MDMNEKLEKVAHLVTPLNEEIALVVETKEEVTAAGVYLPEIARGTCVTGYVAAIGVDAQGKGVDVGDRIYFDAFSTNDIKVDEMPISLVAIDNCKCVVKTQAKVDKGDSK